MSYKEALYADLRKYFGLPEDAEILGIEEDVTFFRGCDTCGHGEEKDFTIEFTFMSSGVRQYKSREGRLADFLTSL